MNVSNSYAKLHLNYIQTKSFVLKVVIRGGGNFANLNRRRLIILKKFGNWGGFEKKMTKACSIPKIFDSSRISRLDFFFKPSLIFLKFQH